MFAIRCKPYQPVDRAIQDWVRRAGGARGHIPRVTGMDAVLSFAQANFGQVNLGDKRRTDRLVQSVEEMCRHPGGTLPDKLNRPADLRGFYRLMDQSEVTHKVLMDGHTAQTRRAIEALGSGAVLLLHDATELDYTSKKSLKGRLGQIGQGTRQGYICHNSLAVRADSGETLGLCSQILHHRAKVDKNEKTCQKRQRQDRESRLWVEGAKSSGPAPPGVQCVDVSDSLSDTFEYMAFEVTQGRHFLLRAREDRHLAKPHSGPSRLFEAVRQLQMAGAHEVSVREAAPQKTGRKPRPGRQARITQAKVAFAPVRIARPCKRLGDYHCLSLDLWAVRVWEPATPKGEEPLEWILLTNCPVRTFKEALERIHWYELRWTIEEYHKGMKTGCSIETLQFEKIERLEPAIALISAVATTLLRLRDAARAPDAETRPATAVVDPMYVEVLAAHYGKRLGPRPVVKAFYMHVARLGGHQNRKADGFPGWITLWRGWMKLQAMVDGYKAARLKNTVTCGKT
jgi:transposase-like protein